MIGDNEVEKWLEKESSGINNLPGYLRDWKEKDPAAFAKSYSLKNYANKSLTITFQRAANILGRDLRLVEKPDDSCKEEMRKLQIDVFAK